MVGAEENNEIRDKIANQSQLKKRFWVMQLSGVYAKKHQNVRFCWHGCPSPINIHKLYSKELEGTFLVKESN